MSLPEDRVDPSRARLDPAHPSFEAIAATHRAALEAGLPEYRDPLTGLSVMTAGFLWDRGHCCEIGCRHCPYIAR